MASLLVTLLLVLVVLPDIFVIVQMLLRQSKLEIQELNPTTMIMMQTIVKGTIVILLEFPTKN